MHQIDMRTSTLGWAWVSDDRDDQLLETHDGGRCWSRVALPEGARPTGARALDERVMLVTTDDERVLRSGDRGRTWANVKIPPSNPFWFADFTRVVGGRATLHAECDHGMSSNCDYARWTTDGGRSWGEAQTLPRSGPLIEVDARRWLLHGSVGNTGSALVRTFDAGRSWERADWTNPERPSWTPYVESEDWEGDGIVNLSAYLPAKRRQIVAIAPERSTFADRLLVLDDLGERASTVYRAPAGFQIEALSVVAGVAHALVAPGQDASGATTLLSSRDGVRWRATDAALAKGIAGSVEDLRLERAQFVSRVRAFTLADHDRLFRTDDAGATWAPVEPCATTALSWGD